MKRLAIALVALAIGGCSLVVGSLSECSTNADCASKGPGLICQDSLCVTGTLPDSGPVITPVIDPRCQDLYGDVDGGSEVIRFGAVVPKTTSSGATDVRGVYRGHAIELAVNQINLKRSIAGHSLVVRVCDDTGDNGIAATEAQELLGEGAVALVTTGSSQTIAIANVGIPKGAVMMSISATSTQIPSAGVLPDGGAKRVWSTAVSDSQQAAVLADFIHSGLPRGGGILSNIKPACVHQDDIAFNGLYDATKTDLLALSDGGMLMPQSIYEPGGDPGAAVRQAQSATTTPTVVLLISPVADTGALVDAWTGFAQPNWLFTDNARDVSVYAFDGGLARLSGAAGTGPSTPSLANNDYADFVALYQQAFTDEDPTSVSYVPNAYDAVLLLAAGATWAQSSGQAISGANIATGLTKLSDTTQQPISLSADDFTSLAASFAQGKSVNVAGASGALDFDPDAGVAPGPIDIWTIEPDGGIATVRTVTP